MADDKFKSELEREAEASSFVSSLRNEAGDLAESSCERPGEMDSRSPSTVIKPEITTECKLSVSIDYDRRINFAMQQNDVPVVRLVRIENRGESDACDIAMGIWIESGLSKPWESRISRIPAGGTYNFEVIDLVLNADILVRQTEREKSNLRVQLVERGEIVLEETYPIEVLAYNEWGGLRSLPEALAAFIMPNHPALEPVLVRARESLRESTGDPSLAGYQIPYRALPMVQAIYIALQACGITYINPPASFEQEGQKIRTPDQIMNAGLGTCLDLSALFAACLEQTGLNPLIVLLEHHAFVDRSARLSLEESGANTLYLALGFLVWYESPASEKERMAPILLLPLRMERRSMQEGFTIRLSDEEPRINNTLVEKMKTDFGIRTDDLMHMPEDDSGIDIRQIFRNFRLSIKDMDRWDVREEANLGLFSFSKFVMWLDLQERSEHLLKNPVVRHLTEKPEMPFDPDGRFPEPHELDDRRSPAETYCPLDADSSQLCAIYAGQDGSSFVLEGPPGTGKSQTITNLIAQCLAAGKRVLFVSEKMAALNVVHHRLCKVGLGPFCLELHSNKASKKEVLDQLGASAEAMGSREPAEWQETARRLQELRSDLNRYAEEIHKPRTIGESLFRVTSRLIDLRDAPRISLGEFLPYESLTGEKLSRMHEQVRRMKLATESLGVLALHPLRAVGLEEWRTTLADEVESLAQAFIETSEKFEPQAIECARTLGIVAGREAGPLEQVHLEILETGARFLLSCPPMPYAILTESGWSELCRRLQEWIERGKRRDSLRSALFASYDESLLDQDLKGLLARLRESFRKKAPFSWLARWKVRRVLKGHVKEGKLPLSEDLATDLGDAIQLASEQRELANPENEPSRIFEMWWKGSEADWPLLESMIDWATRFRAFMMSVAEVNVDVSKKVREVFVALICKERDMLGLEAPVGRRLVEFLSCAADVQDKRQSLSNLLRLDEGLPAGTEEDGGAIAIQRNNARIWKEGRAGLRDWCHWRYVRRQAVEAELEPFVSAFERGELHAPDLEPAFERSVYEWWLNRTIDSNDVLRRFNRVDHERKIGLFKELDLKYIHMTRDVLHARLASQAPSLKNNAAESSEVGVLQRELGKSRRHMPLRKLFSRIPNLLPKIKPCFLMSPLSVAQYLDVTLPLFDMVIFDEASQMPVWDAIGAIARGKDLVVVGDSKQLPPTSFFMKMDTEEDLLPDENDVEELESILDECVAARLPRLYLRWHYRSRHESLITFSNYHYYGNRLLTFPSSEKHSQELGVSFRYVPEGVYDRGGARTNRVEAQAMVAEIVQSLRNGNNAGYGVVTFSLAQQQLVEDLLDEARREYPEIDPYFTDNVSEPVFTKNLENVQGDERDVILLSVCYGKDQAGRLSVSFGPLNRQGGERRLNVAITRARKKVLVFSSIRGDDIDLSRTNSLGVKHLKTFLDYAEYGPRAIVEATSAGLNAELESPFEEDVCNSLTERGWSVDCQVGCSGYRIDLAVKDPESPGRYMLGIECDGANYHSSRTARDRDRLRQAVLEDLGWKLHRIWSTDWWLDPQKEIRRLEQALDDAGREPVGQGQPERPKRGEQGFDGPSDAGGEHFFREPAEGMTGKTTGPFATVQAAASPPVQLGFDPEQDRNIGPLPDENRRIYKPASEDGALGGPDDFYASAAVPQIRQRMTEVLSSESPIHISLAVKRVASCWQIGRTTKRVQERVRRVIAGMAPRLRPRERADFLWKPGQTPEDYRIFRVPDPQDPFPRKAEEIPPEEVANAAESILKQQVSLPREDLMRETARLFGIQRMGNNVISKMEQGIEVLVARNGGTIRDGRLCSI